MQVLDNSTVCWFTCILCEIIWDLKEDAWSVTIVSLNVPKFLKYQKPLAPNSRVQVLKWRYLSSLYPWAHKYQPGQLLFSSIFFLIFVLTFLPVIPVRCVFSGAGLYINAIRQKSYLWSQWSIFQRPTTASICGKEDILLFSSFWKKHWSCTLYVFHAWQMAADFKLWRKRNTLRDKGRRQLQITLKLIGWPQSNTWRPHKSMTWIQTDQKLQPTVALMSKCGIPI